MSTVSKRHVLKTIKHNGFTFIKVSPDDPLPEIPDFLCRDRKQNALNERREEKRERSGLPSFQPREGTPLPPFQPRERTTFQPRERTALPPFQPRERSALPPFQPRERSALPPFQPPQRTALPPFQPRGRQETPLRSIQDLPERQATPLRFVQDLPERQETPLPPFQPRERQRTALPPFQPRERQETPLRSVQDLKNPPQKTFAVPKGILKSKQKLTFDQNATKSVQKAPVFEAPKSPVPVQAVPSEGYHTPPSVKPIPDFVPSTPKQIPIKQRLVRPSGDSRQTPAVVVQKRESSTKLNKPEAKRVRIVQPSEDDAFDSRQASIVVQKHESLVNPSKSEAKSVRIVQPSKYDAFDLMEDFNKNDSSKQSNIGFLDDFDENEAKQWQFDVKSNVDDNKQSNIFDSCLNDFDENDAMQWQFELAKSPEANPSHKVLTSSQIYPSVSKSNTGQENALSTSHVQQKSSSGNTTVHQRMTSTDQKKPLASTSTGQQNVFRLSINQQKPLVSSFIGQQKPLASTSIGQQKPLTSASTGPQKPLTSTSINQPLQKLFVNTSINQQKLLPSTSTGQQKPLQKPSTSTSINQQDVLRGFIAQQKPSTSTSTGQQKPLTSASTGPQKPLAKTSTDQQKLLVSTSIGQQKPLASTSTGQQKPLASTSTGQQKPLASTSVGQQKPLVNTSTGQQNVPQDLDSQQRPSTSASINQHPTNVQPVTSPPVVQPQVLQPSNVKFDLHGKFKSFLKDDTTRFQNDSLLSNDLRAQMYHTLNNVFGFRAFRFCQKSVIIASLLGNNCCVLMPTGAGKSLCYQLTALLLDGLTLVVSPLIALMTDQVAKMKSLKIPAESLRGDANNETRSAIFADLNGSLKLKLLYVAPEMLAKSTYLLDTLKGIHRRGKLSRIVIDEAHCISSWGHDFRTEYSNLLTYFKDFQDVPLMALTAAATPQVVIDIRQNLKIQDSAFFISSFVRSNISYDIMPKSAANTRKLVECLKINYPESSGIFYCLSGIDCDKTAAILNQAGLSAVSYYAGMEDEDRQSAQNRWMQNEVNVICATIAFGMGIDKPDVRYVIHQSMPSSIENYYQETGRAGRDNLPSQCTLLYSFADHVRYLKLFEENKGNSAYQAQRIKNLNEMIAYCENVTDCHRKLLVEHFGEFYDSRDCLQSSTRCYICAIQAADGSRYKAYDFTNEAVEVLRSIDIMNKGRSKATMKTVIDLYRGIEKKTKGPNTNSRLPLFERGKGCSEDDVKRFMRKLLTEDYLSEFLEFNAYVKFDVCYIKLTKKGEEFMKKKEPRFYSHLSVPGKKASTARLYTMPAVSEATVLKEKYKIKHIQVFREAMNELKALMIRISREETGEGGNPYNILSAEGIEQLAAMLPRTESEFLNIDSMNPDKYQTYASRIMPIMQKYWAKIDQYEHKNIQQAIRRF